MLEDTYGHSPIHKMFDLADVYGVGCDEQRAARKRVRLGIIGSGGVGRDGHDDENASIRTKKVSRGVCLC